MISEVALAAAGKAWLEADGWEVFHEVALEWQLRSRHEHTVGSGRADHAAIRRNQLGVVEYKTELSFALFAQAARWLDYAHIVWIGVPYAKETEGRHEAFQIASRHYGFGVLEIGDEGVELRRPPRIRTDIDPALLVSLRPEHKTHAKAGTNRGGQFSTYKATCEGLARFVAANDLCTLDEALEVVPHHYRSKTTAHAELTKAIRKGRVPGVSFGWRQRLRSIDANAIVDGEEASGDGDKLEEELERMANKILRDEGYAR